MDLSSYTFGDVKIVLIQKKIARDFEKNILFGNFQLHTDGPIRVYILLYIKPEIVRVSNSQILGDLLIVKFSEELQRAFS